MMERGNQNLENESVCYLCPVPWEHVCHTDTWSGLLPGSLCTSPRSPPRTAPPSHHTDTHTQVRVSMNITQVEFKRFSEFCLTGKMFACYVLRFYSWNVVYNIFCTVFLSCHRLQNYYRRIRVPSLLFFHLWCNFNIPSFFWQQYILLCVNLTLTLSLLLLEHHSLFLSARKYI